MTRERAKELLPILQAFADGKIVQECVGGVWQDEAEIMFVKPISAYRIKPEKKYRPFANADEFRPHRDRWIKNKGGYVLYRAGAYDDATVWAYNINMKYNIFLENYIFEDGAPCGVEVEE